MSLPKVSKVEKQPTVTGYVHSLSYLSPSKKKSQFFRFCFLTGKGCQDSLCHDEKLFPQFAEFLKREQPFKITSTVEQQDITSKLKFPAKEKSQIILCDPLSFPFYSSSKLSFIVRESLPILEDDATVTTEDIIHMKGYRIDIESRNSHIECYTLKSAYTGIEFPLKLWNAKSDFLKTGGLYSFREKLKSYLNEKFLQVLRFNFRLLDFLKSFFPQAAGAVPNF